MKIDCPRCGDKVEYFPGAVQPCPYCKVSLKLPEVAELPEDLRGKWLKEQAAINAREEKKNKIKQAKEQQAAAEAARLAKERAEEEARRIQGIEDKLRKQQLAQARSIPEHKMPDDYSALNGIASYFFFLAALSVVSGIFVIFIGFIFLADERTANLAPPAFTFGVSGVIVGTVYAAASHLIRLAINVAHDVKISRLLLTRLVHPDKVE